MQIPGMPGAANDAEMMGRADEEAERLLEELKEKVKATTEDIGTLRKKLSVTVPGEVITQHLEHNFNELRQDAVVPGFRKGRAPIQLVQKRFAADVRDSLKSSILGQSYFAAIEKQELDVLGDPLFFISSDEGEKLMELDEALQHFALPDSGDFDYVCEIEIKPSFELPELKGIKVKAAKIDIAKDDVNEEIERQCKIRGRFEPLTKGTAQADDQIIAHVRLVVDGNTVKEEDNVAVGVRPAVVEGVPLEKLDEVLTGSAPGDVRTTECELPDDFGQPDLRGKQGRFEFKIHEIKRLKPVEVSALVEQLGASDEKELRQFITQRHGSRARSTGRERAKSEQVLEYLIESSKLDLPEKLSARQADRAVLRKIIDLQQRGVPESDISAHIDELRTSAKDEVARNLKLEFIMEKVAEQLGVQVTDEEVNSEIARIARMYNQRFDRVRDNLHSRGLLNQLAEQIRQDKCVAQLLADAEFEEVKPKKKTKKGKSESADKKKKSDKE